MADEQRQIEDHPYRPPTEPGSLHWRKIVRPLIGAGLLLLGLAGLVLPILPGWFFITWGVITLAPDIPVFGRVLDRLAERVPQLRGAIDRIRGAQRN